jgi:hypothetical protein
MVAGCGRWDLVRKGLLAVRYATQQTKQRANIAYRHATHSCDQWPVTHRRRPRLEVDCEHTIRAFARRYSHRSSRLQLSFPAHDVHRHFGRIVGSDLVGQALTFSPNQLSRATAGNVDALPVTFVALTLTVAILLRLH